MCVDLGLAGKEAYILRKHLIGRCAVTNPADGGAQVSGIGEFGLNHYKRRTYSLTIIILFIYSSYLLDKTKQDTYVRKANGTC